MKTKNKTCKKIIAANGGMTLVELLVSLSLLVLIVFCFMPLFMSYYQNIKTSGNIVKNNYTKVGLIEKLIGNTGSNSGYEYEVDGIPLAMTVKEKNGSTLQVKSKLSESQTGVEYSQKISGNNIISTPDNAAGGFTTFYADSVTSTMLCFPSHISDDFKEKTVTLFASGFKFNNINEITLQYTGEDGLFYDVSKSYYKVTQPVNSPSMAYLTLYGDNEQINFRTSPLKIQYPGKNDLIIEVDAPNIIMVGEQTKDGKYYYYVTSGDTNEDGTVDVVAKKMNNTDSNGQTVKLNAAMNDVEWISADSGDGKNVDTNGNRYGYYAMCGDNGQIRRFWKDSSGKYYWGGDNTIHYDYSSVQPERESNDHAAPVVNETKESVYSTEASYKYLFVAYPYAGADKYFGDRTDGICLDRNNMGKLYTNTAFTLNAVDDPNAKFWAINSNLLFSFRRTDCDGKWDSESGHFDDVMYNQYVLNNTRMKGGGYGFVGLPLLKGMTPNSDIITPFSIKDYDGLNRYFTVNRVNADGVESYEDFWGENYSDGIVLTSVDTIKMSNTYTSSAGNPINTYTLYCGYVPAVVDLWSPTKNISENVSSYMYTRWLATLGVAYVEDNETVLTNYSLFRSRIWGQKAYLDWGSWVYNSKFTRLSGNLWSYANSDKDSYALSGICGPANYAESESLKKALELIEDQKASPNDYKIESPSRIHPVYPLNTSEYQDQMQKQNTTLISIGYLSNPRAMGSLSNNSSSYDITLDSKGHANVYQWTFDRGTTFLDSDSIMLEDEEGNERNMSIAVGYTLSGLENGYDGGVVAPTVMNCGVVYLRSGGANNEEWYSGAALNNESNIFHMFYYPSVYWKKKGDAQILDKTVSAGYWRDILHPLYYSPYGATYNRDTEDKYSAVASHILFGKRLNCVAWGTRWDSQPEALWGASDGTVMNWGDITNSKYWDQKESDYNAESVRAEFQSYSWVESAKEHKDVFYRWYNIVDYPGSFKLPQSLSEATEQAINTNNYQGWNAKIGGADVENSYLDCRSLILRDFSSAYSPNAYGFISPLDTIEDVTFANDIWVAVGCQGQNNPTYCGTMAVTRSSDSGSWVAVRTWFDLSNGADTQPCLKPNSGKNYTGSKTGKDNNFFLWHAVQISTIEKCNIVQVTNIGEMWYAVGYIDENDNNECDSDEKAVVFYAEDPSKACGTEGGWKLAKSSVSGSAVNYTQACHYNGTSWETVDISSINAMASRDD